MALLVTTVTSTLFAIAVYSNCSARLMYNDSLHKHPGKWTRAVAQMADMVPFASL